MEEAKQLANVVDLVVSVNYNTSHVMLAGTSPGMPGPAAAPMVLTYKTVPFVSLPAVAT